MEDQLLKATKMIENQVDAEIQRMDKMDEDGFEELRRDRMEQLKVRIPSIHVLSVFSCFAPRFSRRLRALYN